MLVIGLILLVLVCVLVKLFDDEIRKSQMRKALVNTACIAGILFLIVGLILIFVK